MAAPCQAQRQHWEKVRRQKGLPAAVGGLPDIAEPAGGAAELEVAGAGGPALPPEGAAGAVGAAPGWVTDTTGGPGPMPKCMRPTVAIRRAGAARMLP